MIQHQPILSEILETLTVLGIDVSSKSFSFETEFTDEERTASPETQDFGDVKAEYEESIDRCSGEY